MNFFDFKQANLERGCFSIHGLKESSQAALSSNLSRWTKEGRLIKLRSGWYAFPERIRCFSDRMFIANTIYSPSYVSLFTALSYYEMIPESVTAVTSVTTLKTTSFESGAGVFAYKSVKPELLFGYSPNVDRTALPYLMATPEKALLDLIYLYPEYKTEDDAENLRLDEDFMKEGFSWSRAEEFLQRFNSVAMSSRFSTIEKVYR